MLLSTRSMLGRMAFVDSEREKLAELLLEVGPDAPTLCEGWRTRDLAAHLFVRENRPSAAAGMFFSALQSRLDKVTNEVMSMPYEEVVRAWGKGPQGLNLAKLLDPVVNPAEHFVHHEDVRRGGVVDGGELPAPRLFTESGEDELFKALQRMSKVFLKKSTLPVVLIGQGRKALVVADQRGVVERGDNVVRVKGPVGELLLWVFGRDAVTIEIEGDVSAVKKSSL